MIQKAAVKCRFCGEIFDPLLKKTEKSAASSDEKLSTLEWVTRNRLLWHWMYCRYCLDDPGKTQRKENVFRIAYCQLCLAGAGCAYELS